MTTIVHSTDELGDLYPPQTVRQANKKLISACPFCPTSKDKPSVTLTTGVIATGDDRLSWFYNEGDVLVFYCSQCRAAGRGGGINYGGYTLDQFAEQVGVQIADDFKVDPSSGHFISDRRYGGKRARPGELAEIGWIDINRSHMVVDREYWKVKRGWDDEVINRAKLGMSVFRGSQWKVVHTIPVPLQRMEEAEPGGKWVFAGRDPDTGQAYHSWGDRTGYFVHYKADDLSDRTVVVAEGEVDAITSRYALGYSTIPILGALKWSEEVAQFIIKQGYTRVIFCGDSDDAGRHLNQYGSLHCHLHNLEVYTLEWPEDTPNKYDLTDAYRDYGADWIKSRLKLFQPDSINQPYIPSNILSLEEIRGDGPNSLRSHVREFIHSQEKNQVLLVRAGAGAGKTHATIRILEELAFERMPERRDALATMAEERQHLVDMYDDLSGDEREQAANAIDRLDRHIGNFSFNIAGVFSPFVDNTDTIRALTEQPELWFHFQARNSDNCENYEIANQMGQNGHVVGRYCETHCPFKERCKQQGYLSQKSQQLKYGLFTARHQHVNPNHLDGLNPDVLVIDENALGQVDDQWFQFQATDVEPFNKVWSVDLDNPELVNLVNLFALAVRQVMEKDAISPARWDREGYFQPENGVYGSSIMKMIDDRIIDISLGDHTIQTVLTLDVVKAIDVWYQPNSHGDDIKLRCLPQFAEVAYRELAWYPQERNSMIALQAGRILVNRGQPFKIPRKVKVIILDATAPETLYKLAFPGKEIIEYAPEFRNPNATVIQAVGHEFTTQSVESKVRSLKRAKGKPIVDSEGNVFDPEALKKKPHTLPALKLIRDAVVALLQRHENLFVIARMPIVKLVEKPIREELNLVDDERLAFGYYGGSLRGSNKYEKYMAAVSFGRLRFGYEVMYRKAMVWAHLAEYENIIDPATITKEVPVYSMDGNFEMSQYRTFSDPLADEVVRFSELSEVVQALYRIRPHSTDKQKFLYVYSGMPNLPFVDQVTTYRSFTSTLRDAAQELADQIWELHLANEKKIGYKSTKLPTFEQIKREIMDGKGSKTLVSSAKMLLEERVQRHLLTST